MCFINLIHFRLCLNAPKYNSNLLCTGSYLDDNLFHHVQITATLQTLTLILDGNLVLNQTTEIGQPLMNQTNAELQYTLGVSGHESLKNKGFNNPEGTVEILHFRMRGSVN